LKESHEHRKKKARVWPTHIDMSDRGAGGTVSPPALLRPMAALHALCPGGGMIDLSQLSFGNWLIEFQHLLQESIRTND
jgi:hypothetical protein